MIVTSNLSGPGSAPRHRAGTLLLAAVDVEWTKNYRVKGGNVPFCYSVVYLAVPDRDRPVDLADSAFWWTSAYVEHPGETRELVRLADTELQAALDAADRLAGHQFTSDLAVLAAATGRDSAPTVAAARGAWRARRGGDLAERRVIDTRYDVDHLAGCVSRRLVDVCAALDLDVMQPELRGSSMTAMHRAWLDDGDDELRERITVLNLRHSLSTGLVALRAAGRGHWDGVLNVNRLLHAGLAGRFAWLDHPTFINLL
ncbi:MAG: hypothetical protein ACRDZ4_10370 [Egibacteraceae bacterium]